MSSLRNLTREHAQISDWLDALEHSALQLSEGDTASRERIAQLVEALQILLDEVHFDKEEQILLPFLVHEGCDWDSEPLRLTREEHERERHLLRALRDATGRAGRLREPDRRLVVDTIDELISAQSSLMGQQGQELFPLGERLSDESAAALEAQLRDFDAHLDGERLSRAERLVERALGSGARSSPEV